MKVLLATDGSDDAKQAAALLAHLPHRDTMELAVVYVNHTPEFHGSRDVVQWMEKALEAERLRSTKVFGEVEEMFAGANAKLQTVFAEGQIGTTIVEQAQVHGSELIVVGATGHSTLDRLLLGSTSDFVATHAHCSVLVVRPTDMDKHSPRIVWAFDDSERSRAAVEQLGRFDWGNRTHLDVVHAVALTPAYAEIPIVIDMEEVKAAMLEKTQTAVEPIKNMTNNVATHVIDAASVGESLVQFASQHDSDLIVMGDTGRGLLGRFLLGSVSRYVLRHSNCSVWIAR